MIAELERLSAAWTPISEVLSVPHTEAEYRRISAVLDLVVDEVGEHDSHPLASMMETLDSLTPRQYGASIGHPIRSPLGEPLKEKP